MQERFKLEEGWLAFMLLAAMLVTVSRAVGAAAWTHGLGFASLVGFLAVVTGLALAKSRFSGWGTTPFVVGYGAFLIGWLNGRELEGFLTWQARISSLAGRVRDFLVEAVSGGTSRDPLMFVIFVMVVTWVLGVAAAWSVFRRGQVWPAVIPPGVALFLNVYYYHGPAHLEIYLGFYLLLLLLLLARMCLHRQEAEWRTARVAFSPELRLDVLRASLLAALLVLSLAWVAPSAAASPAVATAWNRVTRPWEQVRNGWNRLFSSLKNYGQPASDYFGNTLVLSGQRNASEKPIMDVRAPRMETGRYYWRARVFDFYEDGRWQFSDSQRLNVAPDDETLFFAPYQGRRQVELTFTSFLPASSILYVAPQPTWLDRPVELELGFTQTGAADIATVRSRTVLRQGESYTEIASIASVDTESLRLAGDDYPPWVLGKYLQVPAGITGRTRQLAVEIMAGQPTSYDKAVAVTTWLRDNINYNDQRPAPPRGVEPVDHLLFESQQGYCNYYASAMVILLRSQGIPARLAVGFAQGKYRDESGAYRVRELDAHAWPEVFFPGFGWVEFEPTVSQQPLVRPQPAEDLATGEDSGDPAGGNASSESDRREELLALEEQDVAASRGVPALAGAFPWRRVALLSGASLLVLVGLAGVWWALEYRGMSASFQGVVWGAIVRRLRSSGVALPAALASYAERHASVLSPTALAYGRLTRALRWLGVKPPVSYTPYQRVDALHTVLPAGREPAQAIADEYVQETYSSRPGDDTRASAAWSALRLAVWLAALKHRLS